MIKRRIIRCSAALLLGLLVQAGPAFGQTSGQGSPGQSAAGRGSGVVAAAFGVGEELTYTASYSAAVVSADVATVTLRVDTETVDGVPCYRISGRGQTKPFFSVFFKMDDLYTSWIEQAAFRPLLASADIREGGYRYQSRTTFNWQANLVYTHGKNLKKGYTRGGTRAVKPGNFDPLGHFYALRRTDLGGMKVGERKRIDLVMIDTVKTIEFQLIGREIIDSPATGKVRCLKFTCQLASSDAAQFSDGDSFLIWISDDLNKVPVYLETPIRVGSVSVALTGWKNLVNPFGSGS